MAIAEEIFEDNREYLTTKGVSVEDIYELLEEENA